MPLTRIPSTTSRPVRALLAIGGAALTLPQPAQADPNPFDLAGPTLEISVTHDGQTLPIGKVPNLATGDTLSIRADFPKDQSAHYLIVAAFLRGATNPPPKDWFFMAEAWKRKAKDNSLSITVPEGARQMVLFLAPETGGDFSTIMDAVRGRPGEFVRASQDLNQASLDRSRLNAFLDGIRALDSTRPEQLETVSPLLARSLAMKFNADCLYKATSAQAACLTQNQDSLVLSDVHSSSITETLTGAPTDLALQIASTPQGGMGVYSPYIGVVRDLARVLGGFRTAQYQYIPALTVERDDKLALLLNVAPSFKKPQSVLVAALPAIERPHLPPLRAAEEGDLFCAARPGLVLPVDGAPLIYATSYAHDVQLRVKDKDGRTVDLPVTHRADKGGYLVDGRGLSGVAINGPTDAVLHGKWGFEAFSGPSFRLQPSAGPDWKVASGNGSPVRLEGGSAACVERIALRDGTGREQAIEWKPAAGGGVSVTLPDVPASGSRTLLVRQYGEATPTEVALHGPVRPAASLIAKSVQRPAGAQAANMLHLGSDDMIPADGSLTFSIRAGDGGKWTGGETVEVTAGDNPAAARLTGTDGLKLQSGQVMLATIDPGRSLGSSAFGPLRFRVVRDGIASEWQPLGALVRLPAIQGVNCGGDGQCTLTGNGLFLIDQVAASPDFAQPVRVPDGFTGMVLKVPRPADGTLFLKLRDDGTVPATLTVPGRP
jgi:hypothetical protein